MAVTHADLLGLDNKTFKNRLTEAMRAGPAAMAAFEDPMVIERTHDTLTDLVRTTETALALLKEDRLIRRYDLLTKGDRDGWRLAEAEFAKSRKNKLWFKGAVEETLASVKRLRREHRAIALEQAIRQHRDTFLPDEQPSEMDLALWALIDP